MSTLPTASQLAPAVLRTGSPLLFALAGRPAAASLVAGTWRTETDVVGLIDAMEHRLPEVVDAIAEIRQASLLVDVAAALAVLGLCRPHLDRQIRYALGDLARRMPSAGWCTDPVELELRALVAVATDEDPVAERIVRRLSASGHLLGATLGKWAAGQRRRGVRAGRLEGVSMLARRFATEADPRVLALAAFSLPEPVRTRVRVAPPRRGTPVRR